MTLKKLLEEATEGELYVVKQHDLWCAIYRGHGLGKRLVADCLRDGDARLIVYLVNHAAAFEELVEAGKDLLDSHFDMSPLEYAASRGLGHMSDEEGEKIQERLRAALRRAEG